MKAPRAPARTWHLPAAKWTSIVGVALVSLGAGVGYLDKRLSDDLAAANQKNTLTPADRTRYDRVKTYNLAANALFAVGGAGLVTGGVFWMIAPNLDSDRRAPRLELQGRF
jgi:hypothetical protein